MILTIKLKQGVMNMNKLYDVRFHEVMLDEEVKGLDIYGMTGFIEYECMRAFDVVDNNFVSFKLLHGDCLLSDSIISTTDVEELGDYIIRRVREAYSERGMTKDGRYTLRVIVCVG